MRAARELPHGASCDAALLAAVEAEIRARRQAAGALDGPHSPRLTGLEVRRDGLPDWWTAGGNLMLAAPDAALTDLKTGMSLVAPTGALVLLGQGSKLHSLHVIEADVLVAMGDWANLYLSGMSAIRGGTVLIGEHTTSTLLAHLDARNGGIIVVGADGMWANGVGFMTDDMHAIRDMETGRRLNSYGGRIVLERHVWLGEGVKVLGGTRIGQDAIVGLGSMVKNSVLPPNSVSVGRPAKPVRTGVTWSREDLP